MYTHKNDSQTDLSEVTGPSKPVVASTSSKARYHCSSSTSRQRLSAVAEQSGEPQHDIQTLHCPASYPNCSVELQGINSHPRTSSHKKNRINLDPFKRCTDIEEMLSQVGQSLLHIESAEALFEQTRDWLVQQIKLELGLTGIDQTINQEYQQMDNDIIWKLENNKRVLPEEIHRAQEITRRAITGIRKQQRKNESGKIKTKRHELDEPDSGKEQCCGFTKNCVVG